MPSVLFVQMVFGTFEVIFRPSYASYLIQQLLKTLAEILDICSKAAFATFSSWLRPAFLQSKRGSFRSI